MLNQNQLNFVKTQLQKTGQISRNFCLQNYISRLGAIIYILKKQGYEFDASYKKVSTPWGIGKDYIYKLKNHLQGENNDTAF